MAETLPDAFGPMRWTRCQETWGRPTTALDLSDREFVADPYSRLAAERAQHRVAWHETTGRWLTFDHVSAAAVERDRRLGRLWVDREPASYLEPFNLLHRNQMMENEPPEHTRLRRPVAAAFNRGHVERLRPRVQAIAASLLDAVDPAGFDVVEEYAEPLPVLVIAELLGVPTDLVSSLWDWSQAIVRMYEPERGDTPRIPSKSEPIVSAAVRAAAEFAELVRALVAERRVQPRDDLVSDLAGGAGSGLSDYEIVASVVLLLNAGHEASVNVLGNGLVAIGLRAGDPRTPYPSRWRRCCASTRRCSSSSAPRRRRSRSAG